MPVLRSLSQLMASVLLGLCMMIAMPSAKAQTGSEINPEVRSEIEKLNKQFEIALKKKDFASIVDLYSDDATIIIPGGKKITGRKDIAAYWYSLSNATGMTSEVISLGGNGKFVYQIGKWTLTSVKNGVEQITTTDAVLIWKRMQDYSYKIELNSCNNSVASTGAKVEPFEAAKP